MTKEFQFSTRENVGPAIMPPLPATRIRVFMVSLTRMAQTLWNGVGANPMRA